MRLAFTKLFDSTYFFEENFHQIKKIPHTFYIIFLKKNILRKKSFQNFSFMLQNTKKFLFAKNQELQI